MEVAVERKLYFCIHFLLLVGNSFDCFCMSLKNFCHLKLPFTYLLVCGCCRLWVFSSLLVPPPPLSARHTHKKHTWQGRGIICAMYADWFSSRPTFVSSAVIPQDKEAYLDVIHRYLEIHGTVDNTAPIPAYVKNHGIVKGSEVQVLLRQSKVSVWAIAHFTPGGFT